MWKNVSFCTKTYIISYIRLSIFIIYIWNQKKLENIELLRKTWFSAVTSICLIFIRAFLFAISDIFAMNILCLGYLYKFDRTISLLVRYKFIIVSKTTKGLLTFSLGTFGKNGGHIYNLNFLCTSRISFRFFDFFPKSPRNRLY